MLVNKRMNRYKKLCRSAGRPEWSKRRAASASTRTAPIKAWGPHVATTQRSRAFGPGPVSRCYHDLMDIAIVTTATPFDASPLSRSYQDLVD